MKLEMNTDAIVEELLGNLKPLMMEASTYAAEMVKMEYSKAFDEIIRQYYLYKTTSYYRHEVGVGTGTGVNLYRANNISLEYDNGYASGLVLDINADDMDGYYGYSKNKVLDNVLKGIRGVEFAGSSLNGKFMFFHDEFEAKDVSFYGIKYSGTPIEIFQQIKNDDRPDTCYMSNFKRKFNELTKQMR